MLIRFLLLLALTGCAHFPTASEKIEPCWDLLGLPKCECIDEILGFNHRKTQNCYRSQLYYKDN